MDYKLLVDMAMGWLFQTFLFGPKKVSNYIAWPAIILGGGLVWFWAIPDAFSQFQTSWRDALASLALFILAAKGTGSTMKAMKLAPATDSL